MKEITLSVLQGVGDIFWVYKKFAPHYDVLNFNILVIENGSNPKVQDRAVPFIRSWPKVGKVNLALSNMSTFLKLAAARFHMAEIVASGEKDVFYSCNRPLEEGIRIEDIDADFSIQEMVELSMEKTEVPEDYVCLYISGNTFNPAMTETGGVWSGHDWVRFVNQFYEKFNLTLPIVMLGASYDQEVQQAIAPKLPVEVFEIVDADPAQVHYVLKNSKCFLGYQSGLGILADNLDVKQVMMYFPKLDGLRGSWPKKRNIMTKTYNSRMFSQSAEEVIESLPEDFLD